MESKGEFIPKSQLETNYSSDFSSSSTGSEILDMLSVFVSKYKDNYGYKSSVIRKFISVAEGELNCLNIPNALKINAKCFTNPHSEYPNISGLDPLVKLFICKQTGFKKKIKEIIELVDKSSYEHIII